MVQKEYFEPTYSTFGNFDLHYYGYTIEDPIDFEIMFLFVIWLFFFNLQILVYSTVVKF